MTRIRRAALVAAAVLAATCLTPALATPASAATCPLVTTDGQVVPFSPGVVSWAGCNLTGARLDGATLTSVNLDGATLTRASLRGAVLRGAQMMGVTLTDADLSGADLTGARLDGARLARAVTTGAIFDRVTLDTVDLTGATLAGADLRGLIGSPVTGVATSLPPGWDVRGARLLGPGVDLSWHALTDLDLHGADLTDANLDGAQLGRVDLSGSVLTRVTLHSASVLESNLSGATGLATALTNNETAWDRTTCPDTVVAERHDGRSCQRGLDVTAPVISLTAPSVTVTVGTVMPTKILETGSGIEGFRERITQAPTGTTQYGRPVVTAWQHAVPSPYGAFTGDGVRMCIALQVRDFAGHVSTWSNTACTEGLIDDTGGLWTTGSWRFHVTNGWLEGSSQTTTRHGDWAETFHPLKVRRVGLIALACPTCGSVAILVGGHKVAAFNLASTRAARRTFLLPRWSTPRSGAVRILVTSPNGRIVRLDALVVSGL